MPTTTVKIKAIDKTQAAFNSVDRNMQGLDKSAKRLSGGLTGMFAGGLIVAGLARIGKSALDAGDRIHKMGQRTGASAKFLSEMRLATDLSGVSMESFGNALRKMQKSAADAGDGLSTPKRAFAALGIELNKFMSLKPAQQFELLADKLNGIEDPAKRTQIAMDIMGRSGTEMLSVMNEGSEGIRRMREQAELSGESLSQDMVNGAAAANDAMRLLQGAIGGSTQALIISFGPALADIANWLAVKIPQAVSFMKTAFDALKFAILFTVSAIANGFSVIFDVLSKIPGAVGDTFGKLSSDVKLFSDSMAETAKETVLGTGELQKFTSTAVKSSAAVGSANSNVVKLAASTKALKKELTAAESAEKKFNSEIVSFTNSLAFAERATELLQAKIAILDNQFMSGAISVDVYDKKLEELTGKTEKFANKTEETANVVNQSWENMVRGMQTAWVGFWEDLFSGRIDSVSKFFDSFKKIVIKMFAEIVASAVVKKFLSLFTGGGGGGGFSFGGGGGGGSVIQSGISKAFSSGASAGIVAGAGQAMGTIGGGVGAGFAAAISGGADSWLAANAAFGAGDVFAGVGGGVQVVNGSASIGAGAGAGGGGGAGGGAATGSSFSSISSGINAVAPVAIAAAAAILVVQGAFNQMAKDKVNAASTDEFNRLRTTTNEFAGELIQVNDNLQIVGNTSSAVYLRETGTWEQRQAQLSLYSEALSDIGVGVTEIYQSGNESITMVTGSIEQLAEAQKLVASGFDLAKVQFSSFAGDMESGITKVTAKFTGDTEQWRTLLQNAMDSGKLSAGAAFSFMENESGQTMLKMSGQAGEWARFLASQGRVASDALTSEFAYMFAEGDNMFGNLTDQAQTFAAAIAGIRAPALGGGGQPVGFANGGSFMVGGSGGTDTTPVGFMATRGERVTIETPGQQVDDIQSAILNELRMLREQEGTRVANEIRRSNQNSSLAKTSHLNQRFAT